MSIKTVQHRQCDHNGCTSYQQEAFPTCVNCGKEFCEAHRTLLAISLPDKTRYKSILCDDCILLFSQGWRLSKAVTP